MTDVAREIIERMGQSLSDIPDVGTNLNECREQSPVMENCRGNSENSEGESTLRSNKSSLEWNFIDFSKADRCPIYDVDPRMLKKFIGHNVTVINSSQEKFHGCCLTIDPVSLSVILARRTDTGCIRIITLPGYHLKKIFVNEDCVPKELSVSVNDLDIAELYHAKSLLSESNENGCGADDKEVKLNSKPTKTEGSSPQQLSPVNTDEASTSVTIPEFSAAEIDIRKRLVLHLLTKNHLPCKENGDDLELPGGVKIRPPYTIESCDAKNPIIKKKVGDLLQALKNKCT